VRVLYFGTYERAYPRNAQVVSCLRKAGIEVLERHEPVWDAIDQKWAAGGKALAGLAVAQGRLLARPGPESDVVLVGYPGHADLLAARRAARRRPVVFNPLVSLADTFVAERKRFRSGSLGSRAMRGLDRLAFRSADVVVADTEAHARLFAALGARRIEAIFVGAEERLFGPCRKPPERPLCLFVGKLAPLHGIETILSAARHLPDVAFRLVGSGQLDPLVRDLPWNVEHVPRVAYEALPNEYHRATVALGVFGTTPRAGRVIPNKVFQALACGTPLVTADTVAARELVRDRQSALLVPAGDPQALAEAIDRVAADSELAGRLSAGGLAAFRERAGEDVLGRRWRAVLESLP
jgi:glycosyltransferase involved in cell wall biosynthesis